MRGIHPPCPGGVPSRGVLATTDLTVYAIARRVGYDADEAFSRAFKRAFGDAPMHWRAAHRRS